MLQSVIENVDYMIPSRNFRPMGVTNVTYFMYFCLSITKELIFVFSISFPEKRTSFQLVFHILFNDNLINQMISQQTIIEVSANTSADVSKYLLNRQERPQTYCQSINSNLKADVADHTVCTYFYEQKISFERVARNFWKAKNIWAYFGH